MYYSNWQGEMSSGENVLHPTCRSGEVELMIKRCGFEDLPYQAYRHRHVTTPSTRMCLCVGDKAIVNNRKHHVSNAFIYFEPLKVT